MELITVAVEEVKIVVQIKEEEDVQQETIVRTIAEGMQWAKTLEMMKVTSVELTSIEISF